MRTRIGVLLVLATIVAPPMAAEALMPALGNMNSVTIIKVTPAANSLTVSGSYTVDPSEAPGGITLYVRPSGRLGGEGAEEPAQINYPTSTFSASIKIQAGTYDVQAMITILDESNNSYNFFSKTMSVTVPGS